MTIILIIFMGLIVILAIMLLVALRHQREDDLRNNSPYINGDGDHSYYDRGLIEKKEFQKLHPNIKGIRTFRRLFGNKPEDKI